MSRAIQGPQLHLQNLVNRFPGVLDAACGLGEIEWGSPLAHDSYREYQDAAFLARLGLSLAPPNTLAAFLPTEGPRWGALGRLVTGEVVLAEALSSVEELFTSCPDTDSESVALIHKSLKETQFVLKAEPGIGWESPFYHYVSRLAHAYLLHNLNGVPVYLVFVYLLGDPSVKGPATRAEWEAALAVLHEALGLTARLPGYVRHAFVDVSGARSGSYVPR